MKVFSRQELIRYNGLNDARAYIGYNGKVYDVSGSVLWRDGKHQYRHHAGRDLSGSLTQAPHGEDMLDRVPLIGILHED